MSSRQQSSSSSSSSSRRAMMTAKASSAATQGDAAIPQTRPPRCAHLILERDEPSLAAALARELGLPRERVDELMRLGAVHFSLVPPPLQPGGVGSPSSPSLSSSPSPRPVSAAAVVDPRCCGGSEELAERCRSAALARWGAHSRLSYPRRVYADLTPCPANSFARVHLRPWRAPPDAAPAMRVLHVSEDCVVVDKPPCLPVPPSVDNTTDCAAHAAAVALAAMERQGEEGGEGQKQQKEEATTPTTDNRRGGGRGASNDGNKKRWGRGVRAKGPEEAAILAALQEAVDGPSAPLALRPVHRLDTGTSGVLVLARTKEFASWWAGRQRAKTAQTSGVEEEEEGGASSGGGGGGEEDAQPSQHATKLYRCLTLDAHCLGPPPLGVHVHWAITRYSPTGEAATEAAAEGRSDGDDDAATTTPPTTKKALPERTLLFATRDEAQSFLAAYPGARHARLLRRAGGNASAVTPASPKRCELVVRAARRVARLSPRARAAFFPPPSSSEEGGGWEALVELRTGRTHQIRAQMEALGCPLAGDALYSGGGNEGKGGNGNANGGDDNPDFSLPLGLQAAELSVHDPEGRMGAQTTADGWAKFCAARPWWCAEGDGDGGGKDAEMR